MVVTDETGKEPVVILPFDVYESLMGSDNKPQPEVKPVPTAPPRIDTVMKDEISLEERFYVETPEGQENRSL